MKAALCVLLLATALVSGEEKKTEKRGVVGLGYGLGHGLGHGPVVGGYYGHGLGLYNQGLYGHGLYGHGLYGHGLYGGGGGLYGHGLYGHGLYGHGLAAPLASHGLYSAPLAYSPPLLGLGHGWH